jgi:peptidoglycan/LPS O-acetylase OafA/YrhL
VEALRRIRGWSGDAQFTLAAAVALVVGPLLPWLDYPSPELSQHVSGIELNAGLLCLVVGVVAVWVLNRSAGPELAARSGALAGLALLAGALVLETLIKHFNDPVAPLWGMWVTGLAALALLVGSLVIPGASDEALPPPD